MKKQNFQLNHNRNHYTEQKKQYKDNIIKDKNQLNDNKHNVSQLSSAALDLLKDLQTNLKTPHEKGSRKYSTNN